MATFTIVNGDDWEGLFVDGKLVSEGHSLSIYDLLHTAKTMGPITEIVYVEADYMWLEIHGSFPNNLSEVVLS